MATHHPTDIKLHQQSRVLEVVFNDGVVHELSCEYLRVFSPSAEVRAHTGEVAKLVFDKEMVNIKEMTPVGQYAIKIHFDDGHNSGLYDWDMLYQLGVDYDKNWAEYTKKIANRLKIKAF